MLTVHLSPTSWQPWGYASATIAQMVSNLHPRKGVSPPKTGLRRPTAGVG